MSPWLTRPCGNIALMFVVGTFLASWLLWAAAAAIVDGDLSRPSMLAGPLYLLGVYAPAFVGLALTARAEGREGMLALLRRTLRWSVDLRWYAFAVGYLIAVKAGVAVVHRLAAGTWPAPSETPWMLMLVATVFSTPFQAGEEIGWRGYLLPRLAARTGLPVASVVVGVIWASWHLPFFYFAGTDKSGQPFPAYLLAVTALSVAMAWLYWRTQGSLLLTMLMHAAVNNTNWLATPVSASLDPFTMRAPLVTWVTVALMWLPALYFLVAMRARPRAPW